MPMPVTLKKCAHKGCTTQFPEHYYDDFCSAHGTPEGDVEAKKRADALVLTGGARLLALASFAGFSKDEISGLREQFIAHHAHANHARL